MYQNAAILAALAFLYGVVAGRIERSWISGPMVFTGVGVILGPECLGVLRLNVATEGLRILAELTLAMVLFTDVANADLGVVRRSIGIPERLLLIGLPLTIVLGFLFAVLVFPKLDTLEVALLAAILAPTDAALGKPIVTSPVSRHRFANRSTWRAGAETTGGTLALVAWVAFWAGVVGQMAYRVAWSSLLYAVLSLTVIRMLPVFLCLAGTGMGIGVKLFIDWFGPRGLASIVFGIMVLDEALPGNDVLAETIVCTVRLSIVVHGATANPLANAIGAPGRAFPPGPSGP